MDTVQKALWYVETHSRQTPDLEQIANAIQVSPYHPTRAFAAVFGTPLMRYARRNRHSQGVVDQGEEEILPDVPHRVATEFHGLHDAPQIALNQRDP